MRRQLSAIAPKFACGGHTVDVTKPVARPTMKIGEG